MVNIGGRWVRKGKATFIHVSLNDFVTISMFIWKRKF